MRFRVLFLSFLIPSLAHCQFIPTDGTPTAEQAENNVCIDITSTPRPVFFPGSISVGTTNTEFTVGIQPHVGSATIGMPQSDGRGGGGAGTLVISGQEPQAGLINYGGGYTYLMGGASHGDGYSAVAISAATAGTPNTATTNAPVILLGITGRPGDIGYQAGNWLNGGTRFIAAAELTVTAGENNDVDLHTSDNIDSTIYEINTAPGDFTFTGFGLGSGPPQVGGWLVILRNNTAYNMTLADESASSNIYKRIQTNTDADRSTSGPGTVTLIYSGSQVHWQVVSFDP